MHEDICSLALDKKVFLIIVPFHKQLDIDGSITTPIPAVQTVNSSVLRFAPCSVAVHVNHNPAEESIGFGSGTLPSPRRLLLRRAGRSRGASLRAPVGGGRDRGAHHREVQIPRGVT